MDPEVLKAKAVSKGLITAEQAQSMSKGEALQLIFAPGFSTAEKVTAVSGRGVGMDVVRTNISRLNGIIDLESEKDKGSRVKIRLPLTLAVTVGLEVEVGDERYLIPQESIVEIVRLPSKAYETVVRERRFLFRNQFWNQLFHLADAVQTPSNGHQQLRHGYIVVLGQAERRIGLLVDNVLQQHEVVLKPLGKYIARFSPPEANGATIMGDGSVQLILNPAHFMRMVAATPSAVGQA
jgi:two-component system, chemotaxis family, sensor kinase CheA